MCALSPMNKLLNLSYCITLDNLKCFKDNGIYCKDLQCMQ